MASAEFEHFIGINTIPDGALFHPNGTQYVFSSGSCVMVGDLIDAHKQEFLKGHDDNVSAIALSGSGKYIASGQRGEHSDLLVWDFETRSIIYRFEEHDRMIQAIAFSDDEKIMASIGNSEDDKLMFWDLSNGCIIASASKLPPGTSCLTFGGFVRDIKRRDTDQYLLCTAGLDGLVLWSLDPFEGDLVPLKLTGEVRATIQRQITDVKFSDDREYLYASTTSGDYLIAGMKQHKILKSIQATRMSTNSILTYQNGVLIGCGDGTIKIFDLKNEFQGQVQLDGPLVGLSFSTDKIEVLGLTALGTVARVNLQTLQYIILSESHTQPIVNLVFDYGRLERFATASTDGTIKVWDLVEYMVICTCKARKDQDRGVYPLCIAFSDMIMSGWTDGKVLGHSAETGDNYWVIENAHLGGVTSICLSHNKRFLLTGGPQGEVRLWELRTREMISHLKEHKQKVTCLVLFQNDTMALSSSRDRCILRWNLKNEWRAHCHTQRMGGIHCFVLTKDETHIVSVGQEKKLTLWNVNGNDLVFELPLGDQHDEGNSVAISHDGNWIVTGGSAGLLKVWSLDLDTLSNVGSQSKVNIRSNQFTRPPIALVASKIGHSRAINSVAFSLDDKQIVSVGEDGGIFVWCFYT